MMFTIMQEPCPELTGVWKWDTEIPFEDIITYLTSSENNKSKNLKLVNIASYLYQYNEAYGLNAEQKARVQDLYKKKQPITIQNDLTSGLKHIKVFINNEHYAEEAILHSSYGKNRKLEYFNKNTHNGLGRILTKDELQEPDFKAGDGTSIEAKTCWENAASLFDSNVNLDYSIDPQNFEEHKFLTAFNKLPQTKALHKAKCCWCLVKNKTTFGYLIEVNCSNGIGVAAKILGPLEVNFMNINPKFV